MQCVGSRPSPIELQHDTKFFHLQSTTKIAATFEPILLLEIFMDLEFPEDVSHIFHSCDFVLALGA